MRLRKRRGLAAALCLTILMSSLPVQATDLADDKQTPVSAEVSVQQEVVKEVVDPVSEPVVQAEEEPEAPKIGWVTDSLGDTYYYDAAGVMIIGWKTIEEKRYYFDAEGKLQKGWFPYKLKTFYGDPETGEKKVGVIADPDDHKFYYVDSAAGKTTGWITYNGAKYYFDPKDNGAAVVSGWFKAPDGKTYYMDPATGKMMTGLITVDGEKYYLDPTTGLYKGWKTVDGIRYYFNKSNGGAAEHSGWFTYKTSTTTKIYYMDPETCAKKTGLVTVEGKIYYVDGSAGKLTGWRTVGGKQYYFDPKDNGAAVTSGWFKDGTKTFYLDPVTGAKAVGAVLIDGEYYYFDSSLGQQTGWKTYDGIRRYYNPANGGAAEKGWFVYKTSTTTKTYYFDPVTGQKMTGLVTVDGDHYYIDGSLGKVTGWRTVDGVKAYFDPNNDGKAAEGWFTVSGKTFYMYPEGKMAVGLSVIDGDKYYIDATNGVTTGWKTVDGNRYYFDPANKGKAAKGKLIYKEKIFFMDSNGVKQTGWVTDPATKERYYIDGSDGALKGWQTVGSDRYYFDETTAVMQTGWFTWTNGQKYYLDPVTGKKTLGWKTIDGKSYFFSEKTGIYYPEFVKEGNEYYYLNADGSKYMGEMEIDGRKYFFNPEKGGAMAIGWQTIDGKVYYFGTNGTRAIGMTLVDGKYYMFIPEKNGKMNIGWVTVDGKRYYSDENGVMFFGTHSIDGKNYYFNKTTGALITDGMTIKAQDYSSSTNYLILLSDSAKKVKVFKGKKYDWELVREYTCSTGKASTPTPKGNFSVMAKKPSFGESYTCWYFTQFHRKGDSKYGFHSVLYYPGSKTRFKDGRLGLNISHGCVRMELNSAKWIYDTIPIGSTVISYQ